MVKTERKSVSSAHILDGLGKLKEHAPHSEHVHLHQDIGHIRKNQPSSSRQGYRLQVGPSVKGGDLAISHGG